MFLYRISLYVYNAIRLVWNIYKRENGFDYEGFTVKVSGTTVSIPCNNKHFPN